MTVSGDSQERTAISADLPAGSSSVFELLTRDLNETDQAILSATIYHSAKVGNSPTAMDIQEKLRLFGNSLGRTQLYERLNNLDELGFLKSNPLDYPRTYHVNESTLLEGSREWIQRRVVQLNERVNQLEDSLTMLYQVEPGEVVSLLMRMLPSIL